MPSRVIFPYLINCEEGLVLKELPCEKLHGFDSTYSSWNSKRRE